MHAFKSIISWSRTWQAGQKLAIIAARSLGVVVHQGSVLIPLLLIVRQEALFTKFRTDCPLLLLYKDDLVIKAESMKELLVECMKVRRRIYI